MDTPNTTHANTDSALWVRPDGPEAEALRHDTRRALRRAVLELPEEYRDMVILHVYGGVPLRELAERRGKSESWGKVTFYRAKALLREKLEGWT